MRLKRLLLLEDNLHYTPKESVSDDINVQINKNMCVNTRTPLIKTIVSNSVLPLKTENGEDLFYKLNQINMML